MNETFASLWIMDGILKSASMAQDTSSEFSTDLTSSLRGHQVSLFDESGRNLPCVGTIISSYLILTLASCLYGKIQASLTMMTMKNRRFGARGDNRVQLEEEQIRSIGQIIFHPSYNKNSSKNDIAILVLNEELDLNSMVKSMPIFSMMNEKGLISQDFMGYPCLEDSKLSYLKLADPFQCPSSTFQSDKLCLLTSHDEKSELTCSAPLAGSSLICSDADHGQFLCGILALSLETEEEGENAKIYTNITHHLTWIESASAKAKKPHKLNKRDVDLTSTAFDKSGEFPWDDYREEEENPKTDDSVTLDSQVQTTPSDTVEYDNYDTEVPGSPEQTEWNNTDYDGTDNRLVPTMFGIGTTDVKKDDPIPYQLSLMIRDGDKWRHHCGAVILDNTTAITAAHCFDSTINTTHYQIVAGDLHLDTNEGTEQLLSISRLIIHPRYKVNGEEGFRTGNDIAIIHVDRFRLNGRVDSVWLSPFRKVHFAGVTALASGWGKTSNAPRGQPSNKLQKGNLSILPPTTCRKFLKDHHIAKFGIICALNPDVKTCSGDSGGPLVIPNYEVGGVPGNLLVGITSFGGGCGRNAVPGGYTEISHFYDWIQENRENKPCPEDRLPCLTGDQCYNKEWKCDGDRDCRDGSDEMNCSNMTSTTPSPRTTTRSTTTTRPPTTTTRPPTTTTRSTTTTRPPTPKPIKTIPCGGFIKLDGEQEIVYKVPSEKRQRQLDSVCLWIVSTGRKDANASIEVTTMRNPSAQFHQSSDVIFAQHSFKVNNSMFTTIDTVGTRYTIAGPFMTLYYITNSSAPNVGFHLKLKDTITSSDITGRLNVKLIPLPNVGGIQEFSYPSSVSGASTYSDDERTFFILKPQHSRAKMSINLTFVDTEQKYDWLEILTYKIKPTVLIRFDGRSNWTEQTLEALENQPILFYFHSDGSQTRGGFKIQYSEKLPTKTSSCGGFIRLENEHEILYKVPEELRGQKSVCVWVIATAQKTAMEWTVHSNSQADFDPSTSSLFALLDFKINAGSHIHIKSKNTKYTQIHPFIVLHFATNSSASNSGFHMSFKETGASGTPKPVKYLEITTDGTSSSQEFKYPISASNYTDNERTFIIVKPEDPLGKMTLNMKSINTESNYDWVDVLGKKLIPHTFLRFNGTQSWSSNILEGEEGEPFIIYFHSDGSTTRDGFKFSYSEKKPVIPTTSCGGFIRLDIEQEILYKVPEELRGQKSVCVWVIATAQKTTMEWTVHSNSQADFDPSTSSLFALVDLRINVTSQLNINIKNTKYTRDYPFIVLHFATNSSASNSGLHMSFKETGASGSPKPVKYLEITTDGTSSSQEFKYPVNASNYADNERTFIIVKPEDPLGKMTLNMKSINTESNYDWIEVLGKKLIPHSFLRFNGTQSWSSNILEGEEGEPFIIYFHSDGSTTKDGFKFAFSEKRKLGVPTQKCGGFISFEQEHELIYRVPSSRRGQTTICVWVISNLNSNTMEATLVNNQLAQLDSSTSSLTALHEFNISESRNLKVKTIGATLSFIQPFIALHFRTNSSTSNSGFHLKLKGTGTSGRQNPVKQILLTASGQKEFRYPLPPNTTYSDNERTFIIIKPSEPDSRVQINPKSMDTEKDYDWFEMLSFNPAPKSNFRFHGSGNWSSVSYAGIDGEPFIIYFRSDGSRTRGGIKFTYNDNVESTFVPCRHNVTRSGCRWKATLHETAFHSGQQVILSGRPGECSNLSDHSPNLDKKVGSVNSWESCFRLYKGRGCTGDSITIDPDLPNICVHRQLSQCNYRNVVSSIGSC